MIKTTAHLLAAWYLISGAQAFSQVGVNILTTHTSAAMQIASPAGTFRGLLTPSMSPYSRVGISSGTNSAADGLIVYDTYHKMHYFYNSAINRWASMSPFLLTTPNFSTLGVPYGVITTPSSPATFSLGINTQTPAKELDVSGNAGVTGSLQVGDDLSVTGDIIKTGFPVNPFVPAGTIVMWHGSTIPSGWTECNGGNNTPDLRGRFIVAAGQASSTTTPSDLNPNYSVNGTGGENTHALTVGELAKHNHNATGDGANIAASGGLHNHEAYPHGQGLDEKRSGGNTGGLANDSQQTILTNSTTHSHPNSEFSGKVGDGTANGLANQAHENRPQYYVLRFIMKL
jgi:microcystin-dependent protein